jgi:hypothetical protein
VNHNSQGNKRETILLYSKERKERRALEIRSDRLKSIEKLKGNEEKSRNSLQFQPQLWERKRNDLKYITTK